ncbi:MAG: S9 family peptidase [Ignavibacteria bacterium]|nr:S9 family peptidase [Ignavibacteria bacterium]
MNPPKAKQREHKVTKHGDTRIDPYYWLRVKDDPEVLAYIKAENDYTNNVMNDTKALQEKMYNEIVSRIKESDESLPYLSNGYYYFFREESGKNYRIHFRRKNEAGAQEELFLDVNEIAGKAKYCSVDFNISPDNKIMCYLVDTHGSHYYTMYFKDLSTGELLPDILHNTGEMVWFNDSRTLLYNVNEGENISKEVKRHILGTTQSQDISFFQESGHDNYVFMQKSKSRKYIFIQSGNIGSNETYFADADDPGGELRLFTRRMNNLLYVTEHNGDMFYIHTNMDAKNWRVMVTPIDKSSIENWTEFIPGKDNVKIEGFEVFRNHIEVIEKDYGLTKIRIINLNDNKSHYVQFPEDVYNAWPVNNEEYDTEFIRYNYTSFITPMSQYDHDMNRGVSVLRKQKEVPGYSRDDYVTKRLFAPSHDGKLIPVSMVYKKGLLKGNKNILYLNAYGSYGMSSDVFFASSLLSLINRGFVYAIAHVRGGGELGEEWYEDGKMLNKKNTFKDFISCAEFLISEGFTFSGGIIAQGTSAGGTLVGAVANMRPELFKCIIANVPAVDTLNDMIDGGVHNAPYHFEENGNPDIEEQYYYMKSYIPYENITKQEYPNILIKTGFHDNNVKYWGPVKYAAKLRENWKGDNLLLLKTDMDTAHFGPSARYENYKESAYEYAFILKCFGIED